MSAEQELEAYERTASWRVGTRRARELRREIESHLATGTADGDAKGQALKALGDLRASARRERARHDRLGGMLLFAAPVTFALHLMATMWPLASTGHPEIGWWHVMTVTLPTAATIAGTVLTRRLRLGTMALGTLATGFLIPTYPSWEFPSGEGLTPDHIAQGFVQSGVVLMLIHAAFVPYLRWLEPRFNPIRDALARRKANV